MDLDALFNHARDSLAAARKSLYELLEQLRHTGNGEYSEVASVVTSVAKAEEDLDGMASKWVAAAEKKMHGEGISFADEVEMLPEARLYEEHWQTLAQLAREQQLDFSKFLPSEDE